MSSNMNQPMSTIDLDNLFATIGYGISDPTPPPPPPPIVPNGMGAAHRFEQTITSMAPQSQDVGRMQPGPLYSQAAYSQRYSQGQNWPIAHHVQNAAATAYPAAPPQPYNNVTAQQVQNGPLYGYLPDGTAVYQLPAPYQLTAPTTIKTKKRKRAEQHQEGPYVKKPPNAFMIFMKEQRPQYAAQMTISGSAVVNGILGQKWKSLSEEEQAKYYQQADGEKRRHAQCHPHWTTGNNYGVKRKRDRSKTAKAAQLAAELAEASTSAEVSQPAKSLCVASVVVEAPPTNTHGTESSNLQTIQFQSPDRGLQPQ